MLGRKRRCDGGGKVVREEKERREKRRRSEGENRVVREEEERRDER